MTDSYENIRRVLEGLRDRCAQEAERVTGRRRAVAALVNSEAVKPCEVAAAIREIDVQQSLREIELLVAEWKRVAAERLADALQELEERKQRDEALLRQALEALEELQYAVVSTAKTDDVSLYYRAIVALNAALAEPTCKQSLPDAP